jgi:hypothetical protein
VHERTGDEQPAAHPAGQVVGPGVGPAGELGDLEGPLDGGRPVGPRHPVEPGEDLEVLPDGQLDVEVVLLRHDAHLRARLLALRRDRQAARSSGSGP